MFNIEFPGLGISFSLSRVAFTIFDVEIYWYGIFIGMGMLLALALAFRLAPKFGIDVNRMIDVIVVGLICAIICGRLYYVVFSDLPYNTFFDVIDIRSGGIGIYGAIIGAFVGAFVMCKIRKVPVLPLFDLAGMGFLIGQGLGRWGNFFNQEAFGTNTTLPWGMKSEGTVWFLTQQQAQLAAEGVVVDPSLPVHPTFLYESLWCALGFLLIFLYRNRRKFNGEMFLFYVMWYGLGRFMIEGLRTDSLMISGLGLRVSQVVAATSVLIAFMLWIFAKNKLAGKPLQIPEIPPYFAKVKVQAGGKEQVVEISWPANGKVPNKQERLKMAEEKLEEENAETAEEKLNKEDAPKEKKDTKKPEQKEEKKEKQEKDKE